MIKLWCLLENLIGVRAQRLFLLSIAGLLSFTSCVDPFDPHIAASEINLLVVEGYINAGPGVTQIQLSKVSPIESQLSSRITEKNATVWIESESGETFQLTEQTNGIYESDSLELPTDTQYRLHIERENGKIYTSEYQPVKITPPIDSLHWEWRDQLYIYANAHDDASLTSFYTWTFQEDWMIRSKYWAPLKYEDGMILPRPGPNMVKMLDCYRTNRSRELILASSRQLVEDAIRYPIIAVSGASDRIQHRYRIIVHQRTLTEEEYDYLILMKKNSEQNGSFFDPMPSQLFGNIFNNENRDELVIGYVGVYTTQQAELNLYGYDLPITPIQENCDPIDFENTPENLIQYLSDTTVYIPFELYNQDNDPEKPRVIAMPAFCVDCRLRGGSNVKPNPDWVW